VSWARIAESTSPPASIKALFVRALQGAIMPDGQKYEDWLEDKEGRAKDEENE
jgi:hypothetical protein